MLVTNRGSPCCSQGCVIFGTNTPQKPTHDRVWALEFLITMTVLVNCALIIHSDWARITAFADQIGKIDSSNSPDLADGTVSPG